MLRYLSECEVVMIKSLAAIAALCATVSVQAAPVTVYTDEASYLAAVGATRTYIDFAGSPGAVVSGAIFSPDVAFGSCTNNADASTCGTSVLHNSDGITDLGGSAAPNGVASLAWRFILPDVFAFGFNYVSGQINSINLVGTGLALTNIDTSAASGFIGLVSDAAFYGAIAVNGVFASGGNDRYFIDDFRINAQNSVPEPASLSLAGLALIMLAGVARRRRG
jgi:hypothetical protein